MPTKHCPVAVKAAALVMAVQLAVTALAAVLYDGLASIMLIYAICAGVATWLAVVFTVTRPLQDLLGSMRKRRLGNNLGGSNLRGVDEVAEITHEYEKLHQGVRQRDSKVEHLQARFGRAVREHTEDLRRSVRRLQKSSETDSLTGLGNRAFLDAQLDIVFKQARANRMDLTCVMIDVDNFKEVNDTSGHAAGDDLLAGLGRLLRACTRPCDVAGRYGGDEFVLLLPDCSCEQGHSVAERIRKLFAEQMLCSGIEQCPARLSMGVAGVSRNDCGSGAELLAAADRALYRAKEAGRNCVAV